MEVFAFTLISSKKIYDRNRGLKLDKFMYVSFICMAVVGTYILEPFKTQPVSEIGKINNLL